MAGSTSEAGFAALALNAGPSHRIPICSVRWNRRGPARSMAISSSTARRRQSMTAVRRATSPASSTSGPRSADDFGQQVEVA